jgi:heme/copper-type cytochrome/quinol oxidase subunit 2
MSMRMRQWVVFATLAASVLFLVSAAAQPFDPSTGSGSSRSTSRDEGLRAVPGTVEGQDQGQVREFSVSGSHYAFAPVTLTVNRNDLVKITFTAEDIPHSFTIDDYRIVKRAGAGQTVTFEFRADKTGSFPFYCNLSQDPKCKDMKGTLTVR